MMVAIRVVIIVLEAVLGGLLFALVGGALFYLFGLLVLSAVSLIVPLAGGAPKILSERRRKNGGESLPPQ